MPDGSAPKQNQLHWVAQGHTVADAVQQAALVEAILTTMSEAELRTFLSGQPKLNSLERYARADNLDDLVKIMVNRMIRLGHLHFFVTAFAAQTEKIPHPDVLAFRQVFDRDPDTSHMSASAHLPRDRRWERSQEIAVFHSQSVHLANMFQQKNKLIVVAKALAEKARTQDVEGQGGYIPLVAVLRGCADDMPNEFVRRLEQDFMAAVERQLLSPEARNPILFEHDKRPVATINLDDFHGLSADERITMLRIRFCQELEIVAESQAPIEATGLGDETRDLPPHLMTADKEAKVFFEDLSRVANTVNRRGAVVLHLTSNDAKPWYRDFLETWLSLWEDVVREMRFSRPLVHVIYFTRTTPPPDAQQQATTRGLRRFFDWLDRNEGQVDPFEDAWACVAVETEECDTDTNTLPEIHVLPERELIFWSTAQTWCQEIRDTEQASMREWRSFEYDLKDVFGGEGANMRLSDFQGLLREFPDASPKGGQDGNGV